MSTKRTIEYIHVGRLVAEVEVTLIDTNSDWSPYFSLEDAQKLETVREALKQGDIATASKLSRVYEMKPVAAE